MLISEIINVYRFKRCYINISINYLDIRRLVDNICFSNDIGQYLVMHRVFIVKKMCFRYFFHFFLLSHSGAT